MNKNFLTVVMYHYVRDLKNSRYPGIRGCDIKDFREQIRFFKKYYNFIKISDIVEAYDNNYSLPPHSILLTFDDAYSDHFNYVFPVLMQEKIQGAFYPPVKAVEEHIVLDVNKIHFILAATPPHKLVSLINEVKKKLDKYRNEFNLNTFDYYYKKLAIANRFDSRDVIFLKRLLQVELDINLRKRITSELFEQIIGVDEDVFSRELYMSVDQIKCMASCGMHIGSHGYEHFWLSSLSKIEQEKEIQKSVSFIKRIGGNPNLWTICYPYGDYNNDTISLLKKYQCKIGFCTALGISSITQDDAIFKLPRLDVNDFPKDANAKPNQWYSITE